MYGAKAWKLDNCPSPATVLLKASPQISLGSAPGSPSGCLKKNTARTSATPETPKNGQQTPRTQTAELSPSPWGPRDLLLEALEVLHLGLRDGLHRTDGLPKVGSGLGVPGALI